MPKKERPDAENTPPDTKRIISRRKMMAAGLLLGTSAAVYCVGSKWDSLAGLFENADVSENRKKQGNQRVIPDIPSVKAYRKFLNENRVSYLSSEELLSPHFKYRSGVCSGVPPRNLWKNILAARRVASKLRARLNVPLRTVISAYRSPEYNAQCPGASKWSQHLQNRALDLVFDCEPREAFDVACQLRGEGFFSGGIGLYRNFIHIDTRGKNATWGG